MKDIRFMQSEIDGAIGLLKQLFPVTQEEFASIQKPSFVFGDSTDEFKPDFNELVMDSREIDKYRIGHVVGEWFYFKLNPSISQNREHYQRRFLRNHGQNDFDIANGHINLEEAVQHYCGLYYNESGSFPSPSSSEIPKAVQTFKGIDRMKAKLEMSSHYNGLSIAEVLYRQFTTDEFKRMVKLPFEEARNYLNMITGIDLIHG